MMLRNRIEAAVDLKTKQVDVPEWGFAVTLREMDGAARAAFREAYVQYKDSSDPFINERVVAMCLRDEDGSRPFDPRSVADLECLAAKNPDVVQRLAEAALELSGLTESSVENAEKKS